MFSAWHNRRACSQPRTWSLPDKRVPAHDPVNWVYSPKLIYDVGMNNGDDTAYYLSRGFRVVAIEAVPELAVGATERFALEIAAGRLTVLNIGISAEEGDFPFWICESNSRLSSFDCNLASLNGREPHHEIRVRGRTFRSVLQEFGTPH